MNLDNLSRQPVTDKARFKAYIIAHGVKNRCRKVDRHMLSLGEFTLGVARNIPYELAHYEVTNKMKKVVKAYLHLDYIEVDDSRGFTCEIWRPFDERHEKRELQNARGIADVMSAS